MLNVGAGNGHRQHAFDRAHPARQGQLTDQFEPVQFVSRQLGAGGQDADRDGEVEARALFGDVGRRQVDRDAARREFEAAVDQGAAHAIARLLNRLLWQANDVECGQAVGEVGLHRDQWRIDTVNGQ